MSEGLRLRGRSAAVIAQETHLKRKRILRALLLVRQAMARDIPPVFSGTVEVDETYLGRTWRNKRRGERAQGTKRGRGTTKKAVFGILCRGSQVRARVVSNVDAKTLLPLLRQRVTTGSVVCSDTFGSYTGVAARGYVHLAEYVWRYNHRRLSVAEQVKNLLKLPQAKFVAKTGLYPTRIVNTT